MPHRNINFLFVISKLSIFVIFVLALVAICSSFFEKSDITLAEIAQYILSAVGFLLILKPVRVPRLTRIIIFLTLVPICTYAALDILNESLLRNIVALSNIDIKPDLYLRSIRIAYWYTPTFILMLILKNEFIDRNDLDNVTKIPNIIYIVVQVFIFCVPTLLVLSQVFGFELTGILATSGLITAIVGFALQPNLSNIFSGIFVNIEQPFKPHDWITIGDQTGKVIDVSWRSTRLRSFQNTEITIPNETVAKSIVTNWDRPDKEDMSEGFHIFTTLSFHPHHDPAHIGELLFDALKKVRPVDGRPELDLQWVKFTGVDEFGLRFHIAFDCTSRMMKNSQENVVMLEIYKVMRHAGVNMTPGLLQNFLKADVGLGALEQYTRSHKDFQSTLSDKGNIYNESIKNQVLLKQVPLFSNLDQDQIEIIAETSERLQFAKGQTIIKQGESDNRLFIIADGVVSIELNQADGSKTELGRLGVGEFFGEMALMTGEPRTADASALRSTLLLVVQKQTIKNIFSENNNFYNEMANVLAERQVKLGEATLLPEEKSEEVNKLANKIGEAIIRFFS
ncbi:TPA: mechanosensitive ion channel [Candidatus Poribacteria bacterium]|nr:mechanosensitive ion channel [Candidatus Poribacteria bacterium]